MIVFVTGGSGCGKSYFAERLIDALAPQNRYYVATMRVVDEECQKRVARHRAQRAGKGYETRECPLTLQGLVLPKGATALVECLPTLLSNEMFMGGDPARVLPELLRLSHSCRHLIVVTNDVFSDGVSYDPETTDYQKRLAAINRDFAKMADCVVEVVFSIPIFIKGALPCAL